MSKKNNKKNSARKNYKIESLEPRLMMDAAASQWLEEIDSIALSDTAATALGDNNFYSRTNWNSKGDVTGLYLQDEESGEVETTRARLKELVIFHDPVQVRGHIKYLFKIKLFCNSQGAMS